MNYKIFSSIENKALVVAWISAFCLVVFLGVKYGHRTGIHHYGIAESVEWSLTYDYPVKIKSIQVVSGQYFRKGELLIELDQTDLEIKINNLKFQLLSLQTELNLLQGIQANLSVIESTRESTRKSKKPRKKHVLENRDKNPIEFEIKKFKGELVILEKRKEDLFYFANFSGSVGMSKFSPGEIVSPYTAILTLHRNLPTYVKAYIREESLTPLYVGQAVVVTSVLNPEKESEGKIFTVGGKIGPIPDRITPFTGVPLFGREVLVTLPEDNPFVLGEKLGISELTPSLLEQMTFFLEAKK